MPTEPTGGMNVTVHRILDCLNRERIRCTYGAVAEVIGGIPLGVSHYLEARDPRHSWIVNKSSGRPTDYLSSEMHPDLRRTSHIITTGEELQRLLKRCGADPAP